MEVKGRSAENEGRKWVNNFVMRVRGKKLFKEYMYTCVMYICTVYVLLLCLLLMTHKPETKAR